MLEETILEIMLFITMIIVSADSVISIFKGSELEERVEALEEALEKMNCENQQ